MMKKTIQVAGIIDSAEAQMIIESGATHLGFPLRLAIHKEDISEEAAGRIIRTLKPPYFGVLITLGLTRLAFGQSLPSIILCDN